MKLEAAIKRMNRLLGKTPSTAPSPAVYRYAWRFAEQTLREDYDLQDPTTAHPRVPTQWIGQPTSGKLTIVMDRGSSHESIELDTATLIKYREYDDWEIGVIGS